MRMIKHACTYTYALVSNDKRTVKKSRAEKKPMEQQMAMVAEDEARRNGERIEMKLYLDININIYLRVLYHRVWKRCTHSVFHNRWPCLHIYDCIRIFVGSNSLWWCEYIFWKRYVTVEATRNCSKLTTTTTTPPAAPSMCVRVHV